MLDGEANVANGANEETQVGRVRDAATVAHNGGGATASHAAASDILSDMRAAINAHASYNLATAIGAGGDGASAVEDVIDDFLGGSHSEAMDVIVETTKW